MFGTPLCRECRWQPRAALKARQITQSQACAPQVTKSHFFYPAPYRDHKKHRGARKRGGFCLKKSSRSREWPDFRSLPGICPACSNPFSRSTSANVEAFAMAVWETENSVNPHTPSVSLLKLTQNPDFYQLSDAEHKKFCFCRKSMKSTNILLNSSSRKILQMTNHYLPPPLEEL